VVKGHLAVLWNDFCDVYERKTFRKEDGSAGLRRERVFCDLPCRVSYSGGRAGKERGSLTEARQEVKLFLGAEYPVKAGSVIVVRRKNTNTAYKNSSPPAVYSSHQEISLELSEEIL
jgi:hypothetical protein